MKPKLLIFAALTAIAAFMFNFATLNAQCRWTTEIYHPNSLIENPEPVTTWVVDAYTEELVFMGEVINSGSDTAYGLVNYRVYITNDDNVQYELHRETIDLSQLSPGYLAPGEGIMISSYFWDNGTFYMTLDDVSQMFFFYPYQICIEVFDPEISMSTACDRSCMTVTDCDGNRDIYMDANFCEGQSYDFFGQQITQEGTYFHYDTTEYCVVRYILNVTWVFPNPNIILSGNTYFCEDGSTVLTASSNMLYPRFVWSDGTTTPSIDIHSPGLWTVTVSYGAYNCSSTMSVNVEELPKPEIQLVGDLQHCDGTPVELSLPMDGIAEAYWSNGTTGGSFSTDQTGHYSVTAAGDNGCISSAEFDVVVGQPSSATLTITEDYYYTLNGTVYTASGNYICIIPNATGCDSVITLQLTITHPNSATVTYDTTCVGKSFAQYGLDMVFDEAGDYAFGLSSTHALQLHVVDYHPSIIASEIMDPCEHNPVVLSVDCEAEHYSWNTGPLTPTLTVTQPGYYAVTVSNRYGCEVSAEYVQVGGSASLSNCPDFCMVSVTPAGYSVMNWTPNNANARAYNIYRMVDGDGVYQLAATVVDENVWTDYIIHADQHHLTYRISAVDACGAESAWSDPISPMHLYINLNSDNTIHLSWTEYQGHPVSVYNIKHHLAVDLLVGTTTETWFDVPADIDIPYGGYYYIEAVTNCGCTLQYGTVTVSEPRSNRIDTSSVGIVENVPVQTPALKVYPNPTTGLLNVKVMNNTSALITLEVYDLYGRLVERATGENDHFQINTTSYSSGVYIIRAWQNGAFLGYEKFVKR